MEEEQQARSTADAAPRRTCRCWSITLLKGVIYREGENASGARCSICRHACATMSSVLGLDLVLDEAEGYAFLRSRGCRTTMTQRRRFRGWFQDGHCRFPVSLLLALLRKKLAEFDASGGDTRLVLTRDDIVELVRVFLPDSSNEAKLIDQIETHINKIVGPGLLASIEARAAAQPAFEVRRILKAFIDAQWLAEFDARLAAYRTQLARATQGEGDPT